MQAKSLWLRNRRLFRLATLIIFWLSSSALCFTSEPTCFPVSSPWIWTLKNAEIKVWVIHTIGDWDSLMAFENQSSDGGWWTVAPVELFLKRYCHHYCLPALSLLWLWRRPKLTRENTGGSVASAHIGNSQLSWVELHFNRMPSSKLGN